MPLDRQVELLLEQVARAGGTPMHLQTPAEARATMLAQTAALGRPEPVAKVENRSMPGPDADIPLRIYTPAGNAPFAGLVFFHGGGWVIGSIDTHDNLCRSIANAARCVVVSVEYRLAPEHKFPAAVDDAYAATRWTAEQAERLGIDPGRIAVGGDSAGGNLAAVVALMARDRGGPNLALQVLLYPIADRDLGTASYLKYADGHLLTRDGMAWFWSHYLPEGVSPDHPYISPLRAGDLGRLPKALVITAECDPLCDEGNAYGRRLQGAGVPVTLSCYPGMIHGFVRRNRLLDQGQRGLEETAAALRAM
ncbi:MAG TPA: alpha/beta hydrolase [Pirellulales bacterium]|jgi:acetyl esterase|nr:alpha/beta hydrolase [Pirellulales bacterium]